MKNLLFILIAVLVFPFSLYAMSEDTLKDSAPPISDKTLGRRIHSNIVSDPTLPYCAHIVNVHAKQGKVTLKGKVQTKKQRKIVGEKAAELVGEKNVTNNVIIMAE